MQKRRIGVLDVFGSRLLKLGAGAPRKYSLRLRPCLVSPFFLDTQYPDWNQSQQMDS